MKIKEQTVFVQSKQLIKSYISSDGYEFKYKHECITHERKISHNIPVIASAIHGLTDFDEDNPVILYNVKNEEDWNMLVEREWFYNQDLKIYPGPGIYMATVLNDGDYDDTYYIENAEQYLNELQKNCTNYVSNMMFEVNKLKQNT